MGPFRDVFLPHKHLTFFLTLPLLLLPSPAKGQVAAQSRNLDDVWRTAGVGGKGCGTNFGCFTDPAGCDLNKPDSCRNFVLYRQSPTEPNLVDFYLEGDGGEDRFLALGLNTQRKMDGSTVMMCLKNKGQPVTVVNRYNQGFKNIPVPDGDNRLGLTNIRASLSPDGKRFRCAFSKDKTVGTPLIHRLVADASDQSPTTAPPSASSVVTIRRIVVLNITQQTTVATVGTPRAKRQAATTPVPISRNPVGGTPIPYYLIIAESGVANGVPQYHAARAPVVSQNLIDVARPVSAVAGRSGPDTLIRLHGIFMIVGWIMFITMAILFARHLKNLYPNKTMCGGLKLWFVVHRTSNQIGLMFVLIGAIFIFVSIRAWSYDGSGKPLAHSITGILAVILGIMQPVMAFFRPHPGDKGRLFFNWTHRIIGTTAFILALASIFLATKLAKLRGIRTWPIRNIMIAFVVLYALTEIALFAIRAYRNRQRRQEGKNSYDLNPVGPVGVGGRPTTAGLTNPGYVGNLPPGQILPGGIIQPQPELRRGKWTVIKYMIVGMFGVMTLGFVIAMIILIAT